jgi:hypothetical protein
MEKKVLSAAAASLPSFLSLFTLPPKPAQQQVQRILGLAISVNRKYVACIEAMVDGRARCFFERALGGKRRAGEVAAAQKQNRRNTPPPLLRRS